MTKRLGRTGVRTVRISGWGWELVGDAVADLSLQSTLVPAHLFHRCRVGCSWWKETFLVEVLLVKGIIPAGRNQP